MTKDDRSLDQPLLRNRGSEASAISPVFPVSDLDAAVAHYSALGFETESFPASGFAFVRTGRTEIHLQRVPDLNPSTSTSSCYLLVTDADSLYREWEDSEALGYLVPPADTEFGLREFSHIDIDGNVIRIGSPIS